MHLSNSLLYLFYLYLSPVHISCLYVSLFFLFSIFFFSFHVTFRIVDKFKFVDNEYSIMDHFWFIRDHALMLGFETGVDDVDELEYRSFVWEEVGLIRQFTKMILQMSGGRPGWVPDRLQNETDVSAIGMVIWDSATAILMKHEKKDEEKDENYCVKHCNAIIAATWRIEEVLLAHAWRAGVTSPQKTWIKCFREIRELALKCECQIQRQNALEEVWQQIESIQEKAQKILDDRGASLREQVDEDEDSDVSDIFGVILDVTADILVGANNDCVSACSQIIHASNKIEELLSSLLPEKKKEKEKKEKVTVTEIIEVAVENPSHSSVSSPSSPSSPSNHVQQESSISPERVFSESHGEMKSLQESTGN